MTVNEFTAGLNAATLTGINAQAYNTNPIAVDGGIWFYDDVATQAAIAAARQALVIKYPEIYPDGTNPGDIQLKINPRVWSNDSTGDRIVSFRGTFDDQDRATDVELLNSISDGSTPEAFTQSVALVEAVAEAFSGNIVITGHSLGGALSLFSIATAIKNHNGITVTVY